MSTTGPDRRLISTLLGAQPVGGEQCCIPHLIHSNSTPLKASSFRFDVSVPETSPYEHTVRGYLLTRCTHRHRLPVLVPGHSSFAGNVLNKADTDSGFQHHSSSRAQGEPDVSSHCSGCRIEPSSRPASQGYAFLGMHTILPAVRLTQNPVQPVLPRAAASRLGYQSSVSPICAGAVHTALECD